MKYSAQRGNVVIYILVAVALFGALAYVFMRGAKSGQGNLTTQQAKLVAQELISYAGLLERAVDRVRTRGCSEEEISFQAAGNAGYVNPDAPPEFNCHIFQASGGAMTSWQTFDSMAGTPYVTATHTVNGTETTDGDLVFFYDQVPVEVCNEINKQLDIDLLGGLPADDTELTYTTFTGSYTAAAEVVNDGDVKIEDRNSGCYHATDAAMDYNVFYSLLLDR